MLSGIQPAPIAQLGSPKSCQKTVNTKGNRANETIKEHCYKAELLELSPTSFDNPSSLDDMGESRSTSVPDNHSKLSKFSIGTKISRDRIVYLAQITDNAGESKRARSRLFFLSSWMFVRTIGWAAGIAVMVLILSIFAVAGIVVPTTGKNEYWLNFLGTWIVPATLVCFAMWLYGYLLAGALLPVTEFYRKARVIGKLRRPETGNVTRSLALVALETSGGLGRIFFRASTGRTLNAGVRPDVTKQASAMAKEIMLAVPEDGVDSLQASTVQTYDQYIRDVAGLLAIGRIDSVSTAKKSRGVNFTVSADFDATDDVTNGSSVVQEDELRKYLQPFAGQSPLDAIVGYLVPTLALIASIIALFFSI